jgi:DNA-binding transcriptional MerR regulator
MTTVTTLPLMTTPVVAELAGCSYRQIDYWIRQGWLSPAEDVPGSGYERGWDAPSIRRAVGLALLERLGFRPSAAARLLDSADRDPVAAVA